MTPHDFDFVVFFVVFFGCCCCCTVSHSPMLSNCCLSASGEEMPRRAPLVDYHHQVAGSGCRIDAVVFVCRGGAKLCVATDAPKLRRALQRVDRLKKFCRNKNYEDTRCLGVKQE